VLGLVVLGQVNFGITETGITGVHSPVSPRQKQNANLMSEPWSKHIAAFDIDTLILSLSRFMRLAKFFITDNVNSPLRITNDASES
jgi:hypothetical protein